MTVTTSTYAGYDPGGNGKNGFAMLRVRDGRPVSMSVATLPNAEAVISSITESSVAGLGVDTLTCWCTGDGGWRPADHWLRERYPAVRNSVMSPNTLSGSMGINGMAVLVEIARGADDLVVSETHPKVLYYALTNQKYDYDRNQAAMNGLLSERLGGIPVNTSNDHEWDAAVSAYAVWMGMTGRWTRDLHASRVEGGGRIVEPCGRTFFYWPDDGEVSDGTCGADD